MFKGQLGADRWVCEEVYPGLRGGYFVEAGAGDGLELSNTVYLEEALGWNGLCVEPSRQYVALQTNRKCYVSNACLAAESGRLVEFVESESSIEYGADPCSHFSGINDHLKRYRVNGSPRMVTTTSLTDVLDDFQAPAFVHFLSLDTEGSEFEILSGMRFDRCAFGAIAVEHNRMEPTRSKIRNLLESNGYRFVRAVEWDDWYAKERGS